MAFGGGPPCHPCPLAPPRGKGGHRHGGGRDVGGDTDALDTVLAARGGTRGTPAWAEMCVAGSDAEAGS